MLGLSSKSEGITSLVDNTIHFEAKDSSNVGGENAP